MRTPVIKWLSKINLLGRLIIAWLTYDFDYDGLYYEL